MTPLFLYGTFNMTVNQPITLSVVIPSYNRSGLLRRCLESLSAQTQVLDTFEVIVVDDGSTDSTAEMVEALNTPFRLRLLRQNQGGWAVARNAGVEASEGQVCLHVDDDIICSPELVAEHIAAHRAAAETIGIGRLIQQPPTARDWYAQALAHGLDEHYDDLARRAAEWVDCYGANLSMPRSAFIESGGFATDLPAAVDLELGFRLCEQGCIPTYLPRATGIHDDQKHMEHMLRDARLQGEAHVLVADRHPSTSAQLLDWYAGAGSREIALRRILIGLRISPDLLARVGRAIPGKGRGMVWLHFVRRLVFWRSVRRQVSAARWKALCANEGAGTERGTGVAQSVP